MLDAAVDTALIASSAVHLARRAQSRIFREIVTLRRLVAAVTGSLEHDNALGPRPAVGFQPLAALGVNRARRRLTGLDARLYVRQKFG